MEKRTNTNHRVIVLGRGISIDPNDSKKAIPNIGSKLNALAAGLLYFHGGVQTIVISGGPTLGKDYPSEAEVMQDYLFEMFNIPPSAVYLEPKSIDTIGNLTEMIKTGLVRRNIAIPVLSVWQQLGRTRIVFSKIADIDAKTISCQSVIKKHGNSKQKAMLRKYLWSKGYFYELGKELILLILAYLNPSCDGWIWRKIRHHAMQQRHGYA